LDQEALTVFLEDIGCGLGKKIDARKFQKKNVAFPNFFIQSAPTTFDVWEQSEKAG
jgi:hypothetical protein